MTTGTTESITGKVVSTKRDSTGFKIGDQWYSVHKKNTGLKNIVSGLYQTIAEVQYTTNTVGDRTYFNVTTINGDDGNGGGGGTTTQTTTTNTRTQTIENDYTDLNSWQYYLETVRSGTPCTFEEAWAKSVAWQEFKKSKTYTPNSGASEFEKKEGDLWTAITGDGVNAKPSKTAWDNFKKEQYDTLGNKEAAEEFIIGILEEVKTGRRGIYPQPGNKTVTFPIFSATP